MSDNCEENAARTDADQSETQAEFRCRFESRDGPRLHYREHQIERRQDYRGYLDDLSIDEVRALLEEAWSYSRLTSFYSFPLPPKGLPGTAVGEHSRSYQASHLIAIGLGYAEAAIRSQGRAMHNRWAEANEFIRRVEEQAEERVYERWAKENLANERPVPRIVYFIGSASGPIKIGVTVNAQARLNTLQTGHHEKLAILATCGGGIAQEKAYHRQFKANRLNGEWFERVPEIEAEIARLNQLAEAA